MPETHISNSANAGQQAFWNSDVGEKWALCQESLDHLHRDAGERLVAHARPAIGERALDIGCGAGATSMALASAVGPSGSVLGIDISRALIDRAEARRREAGLAQVEYLLADAQAHRFEPGSFDLLVSRFGVMFFSDPVAAFRNLLSALRPGKRMVLACWAGADENPWFALSKQAAVSVLGEPEPTPPRDPGPFAFSESSYVLGILREAGFEGGAVTTETVQLFHPGGLGAVTQLSGVVGPAVRIVREFGGGPEDVAEIGRRLAHLLGRYVVDGGIRIPARIRIYSAFRR